MIDIATGRTLPEPVPDPDRSVAGFPRAGLGRSAHRAGDRPAPRLVTQLKVFNRLGYLPVLDEAPAEVIAHIRRDLRLPASGRRRKYPAVLSTDLTARIQRFGV